MSSYHKYVFDSQNREFIGNFDLMYQAEKNSRFDSWHQDDSRHLNRSILLNLIEHYNFSSILDIGCGKGLLTHMLKKRNNFVLGIDISPTAIQIARARYPDIAFEVENVSNIQNLARLLETSGQDSESPSRHRFDLVVIAECLSYIHNWKMVISELSRKIPNIALSLYIPENPIGYVKNSSELVSEVSKYYQIYESIKMEQSGFTIVYAHSRAID